MPGEPRRGPQIVSVEVHVSGGGDGRGAAWSGWRYLGLACVVGAAMAVALVLHNTHRGLTSSATPVLVKDSGSPRAGDRYLVPVIAHPRLARDVRQLMRHDHCAGSRNAAFNRAVETLYARGVANATGKVLPGRAKLEATTYPRC